MPKINTPILEEVIECRKDYLSKNKPRLKKGEYTVHKNITRDTTTDLIFNDLRESKLQHQTEIMNINRLIKSKEKLIVAAAPGHSIFIDKEEIEFLLKRRLTRAQLRLEYVNQKLNQIDYAPSQQQGEQVDNT